MRCPSRPVRARRVGEPLQPWVPAEAWQVDVVILEHFWGSPSRAGAIGELSRENQKYVPLAALKCFSQPRLLGRWRAHHRDLFSPHCPCGQVLVALGQVLRASGATEELSYLFLTSYPGVRTAGLCAGRRPGDGDPVGSRHRPCAGGAPILLGRQARKQATPT